MVAGVCASIEEYLNVNPTLIRVGFCVLACMGGGGLLAYIGAAILMPVKVE